MNQPIPLPEDRGATDITFAYEKGGQVMNVVVPLSTLLPVHKPTGRGVFLVLRGMPPRTADQED
jgi:hypothetical protein